MNTCLFVLLVCRYCFISHRQPITVVRNLDAWILDSSHPVDLSGVDLDMPVHLVEANSEALSGTWSHSVPLAWMEINTEGSPPNVIPPFLKIDTPVYVNNLQFALWQKAKEIV